MAIWQYSFFIVPVRDTMPVVNDFRDFEWWENSRIDKSEIIAFLENLFSDFKGPTWSKYSWGDTQRNDVWFSYDEVSGEIEDFSFRLDLRDDFRPFLRQVLDFCVRQNFMLLDEEGNKIEPVFEKVIPALLDSEAFRFVTNPSQFLENLSKNSG